VDRRALPLLEAATAGDGQDVPAWDALAEALSLLGRVDEALAACTIALNVAPEHDTTLFLAASLAAQLRRHADVRAYAQRGRAVNPWFWQYPQMIAEAFAQEGNWEKAAQECRAP